MPFSFSLEAETFHPNQYFITIIFIVSFLLLTSYITCSHFAFAQNDNAYAKIQVANNAVTESFRAVLEAESSGANITSLLNELSDAIVLLVKAENAHRVGDESSAEANANAAIPIARAVTLAAQSSEHHNLISYLTSFEFKIISAVLGSTILVGVLFFIWRLVKRNYISNLSDARPEVAVDETP